MVKYIEYNGEKLPVSVSYYAINKLEQESGKGLSELAESTSLYAILFYYALEVGHRAEKKVFDIKREDIPFMLDECWLDFSAIIGEFFTELAERAEKKLKK